jgi:hypothetical protein
VTTQLPADVERSIRSLLEPGEEVLGFVTSVAATLVLTDRRVVIAREGRAWRPANGIRSWRISAAIAFRWRAPRGGVGRLVVGTGTEEVSMFVRESDWKEALRLVRIARTIARVAAND